MDAILSILHMETTEASQSLKAKLRFKTVAKNAIIVLTQLNKGLRKDLDLNPPVLLDGMVEKRDQRKNPGIRGVDRVIRGNSGRVLRDHLGVRVFVYLTPNQNAINKCNTINLLKRVPLSFLSHTKQMTRYSRYLRVLKFQYKNIFSISSLGRDYQYQTPTMGKR